MCPIGQVELIIGVVVDKENVERGVGFCEKVDNASCEAPSTIVVVSCCCVSLAGNGVTYAPDIVVLR